MTKEKRIKRAKLIVNGLLADEVAKSTTVTPIIVHLTDVMANLTQIEGIILDEKKENNKHKS